MEQQILWKKFIKGDKRALSLIFKSFFDVLFNYGIKLTNNPEIVEDSLQDMFFRLWKNKENLGEISNVKIYLLKSLRHQIFDNLKWKKQFIHFDHTPEELFEIEFSHEDFLISEQVDKETRENLIQTLNQLTKCQKEAIYLRYFKDFDFDKISEIMSINVQSVRNNIHRGLSALRSLRNGKKNRET